MAKKPKEVKDIKRECCLTCDYLLTCAEVAGAKCRNYKPLEIDQNAVSTRYLELVQKLSETLDELKQVEQEMKIAEMIEKLPKPEEEKPAISKRNKKIKEMIEKSSTVAEIAEELELKQSTVQKEIDYMVKIGVLKATLRISKKENRPFPKLVKVLETYPMPFPKVVEQVFYDTGVVKKGISFTLGDDD